MRPASYEAGRFYSGNRRGSPIDREKVPHNVHRTSILRGDSRRHKYDQGWRDDGGDSLRNGNSPRVSPRPIAGDRATHHGGTPKGRGNGARAKEGHPFCTNDFPIPRRRSIRERICSARIRSAVGRNAREHLMAGAYAIVKRTTCHSGSAQGTIVTLALPCCARTCFPDPPFLSQRSAFSAPAEERFLDREFGDRIPDFADCLFFAKNACRSQPLW